MKKNTKQKGLDLYNELRSQMSQMTIEEMNNFKIELKGSKEEIEECMKCAQANNESCDRYENAQVIFGEKMDMGPVRHYNNLIIEACKNIINKEEANMKKEFTVNGIDYMETEKGYFYKVVEGKKTRIKKEEFDQAFDELCKQTDEKMDDDLFGDTTNEQVDEWMKEIEESKKKAEQEQAESDKQAEDKVNGKTKKASKPRKSKDIAHESNGITLTAKQVAFIKAMPNDDFYEHGLESALWVDCFCDTVADIFNPMAVGAMVSTLREKGIIIVRQDKVNGKRCKYMQFTELGMEVAKELGLK